ncbi:uncharacterized protein LOC108665496 [Hyalella azteca]|uniref:Uncharacterized protein LOC108665496 n=1 Tax=Hyalella azteca TaxID=294128 RepID=A0A8B7N2D6_HYAAZ|nr:uncharacterized protein LOC108665496 [Hyalella azteca]
MSFAEKRGTGLEPEPVNQRRENFPATSDVSREANLSTWEVKSIVGGEGGGGGGLQSPSSQQLKSHDNSKKLQSNTPTQHLVHPTNPVNSAVRSSMLPGTILQPSYSGWSSMPPQPYNPALGTYGYNTQLGNESILNQMYQGTSSSLNLVSLGLQSVGNFTGILNQFFMTIQNTLSSLMNLSMQMHFIKNQFAHAMSLFSLYRGVKWLVLRLLRALGLSSESDVERAWREAQASMQPTVTGETWRPWRKVLLTTLFVTVPTLIIYIMDALNSPPPRRDNTNDPRTSNVPPGAQPAAADGQWSATQSGPFSGYGNSFPYSSYSLGAPHSVNGSAYPFGATSSYGYNPPFSGSSYGYNTSGNQFNQIGTPNAYGGYGNAMNYGSYGNYDGVYNRYNYNGSDTYPFSLGYGAGQVTRPSAPPLLHQQLGSMNSGLQQSVPFVSNANLTSQVLSEDQRKEEASGGLGGVQETVP